MIVVKRHQMTGNWVYVLAHCWMGFAKDWKTMDYSFNPANIWQWSYDRGSGRWYLEPPKKRMMVVDTIPGRSGAYEMDVSTS